MVSRRELFKKVLGGKREEDNDFLPYPPYNSDRELFLEFCSKCQNECIKACSDVFSKSGGFGILKHNGDLPYIDFGINGCLFCMECAKACPSDVLSIESEVNFNFKIEINVIDCLAYNNTMCYTCKDMCASQIGNKGAIDFVGLFYPSINNECILCGYCIGVCPTKAIEIKEIDA